MDLIVNPHISYLICSNYLSTCWSIQLISYYVNRDYVFFIFPVIILDNKQKRGCEKTRLSFFAALFYFIAMRSLRIAYIYFLYTLLKCDSKSIYYESPRKSCSIQHHCYPYILHRSMPVHPKEHHKAYSCTHQKS